MHSRHVENWKEPSHQVAKSSFVQGSRGIFRCKFCCCTARYKESQVLRHVQAFSDACTSTFLELSPARRSLWQIMGAMLIRSGEQNLRIKGSFLIWCFYDWRSRHDQTTCPPSTSWQHPHLLGTLCWAPPALTSLRDQVLQIGNWIVVQKLL